MERFQGGEQAAFRLLLERHEATIYNFFYRSFGQGDLARDLCQETFLRIVRGRAGFRQQARFTTWMWRIARNLRVATIRRLKFRRHASLDEPVRSEAGSATRLEMLVDEQDPGAERESHSGRFMAALKAAIPALDEDQREVFLLRQMQGLSFQEIAEIQGVNVNTVKSRMRYALQKLRAILADYAPEPGTN